MRSRVNVLVSLVNLKRDARLPLSVSPCSPSDIVGRVRGAGGGVVPAAMAAMQRAACRNSYLFQSVREREPNDAGAADDDGFDHGAHDGLRRLLSGTRGRGVAVWGPGVGA